MTDEMILVPRAELLAWAQDWLRENDPGDGTDCVTPFDWHLLKTPVKAHCTTCSCVPGMTPAVRFDTTPAERGGAVRDHLVRMGWTPPAEAQAQGGGEVVYIGAWAFDQLMSNKYVSCLLDTHGRATYFDGRPPVRLYTTPQSAPVGVPVDVVREYLDAHACYDPALRHPNSPEGLRLREARNALDAAIALAQQSAADRVCPNTLQACRCDKYTPCAAQQPAACAHSWHDYGKVNRAWCSRCNAVAVIGHEDRPYGVLSVTDDGEYRTNPIQQPEAAGEMAELVGLLVEVRSHFTRDDDLPDDLLPRIDAALAAQPGGVGNE